MDIDTIFVQPCKYNQHIRTMASITDTIEKIMIEHKENNNDKLQEQLMRLKEELSEAVQCLDNCHQALRRIRLRLKDKGYEEGMERDKGENPEGSERRRLA
jgi:hypothetical protein